MTKFLSLSKLALQLICVAGRCEIYLVLNGGAREFNCLALTRNIIAHEAQKMREGCVSLSSALGGASCCLAGAQKLKPRNINS